MEQLSKIHLLVLDDIILAPLTNNQRADPLEAIGNWYCTNYTVIDAKETKN